MSKCFPEQKSLGGRVKVELDLSNYVAKPDLKNPKVLIHKKLLKRVI